MVKRYDFYEGNRGYPEAVEWEDGAYVDYDDYATEIARLQAEVERLRNNLDHNTKANDAIVAELLESEATARNYALEEAARLAETSINDGGLAKSMAHFIEVEHWRVYKESCLKYADAIRALKRQ